MDSTIETSVIEVTNLWRRYGTGNRAYDAVRGVSLSVGKGELFGLLGTNGAGKTSTIELLEGLAQPSRGEIRLFGRYDPVRDRSSVRPHTGVMLQQGGFAEELTVAETVRLWAGCSSRARSVEDAVALVGLEHRAKVAVKNLSGGEQRRLDLALATLTEPALLFLDEPTTGMDPEGRSETWRIIRGLKDMGTTIVMTTHYLEEAEALADRIAIMHRGRIAVEGSVPDIVGGFPSSLTFTLPAGSTADDLPPLEELAAKLDHVRDNRVRLVTDQLQHTATEVLAWARDRGIPLTGLDARSASLEEAFLHIANNDLDEEASPNS